MLCTNTLATKVSNERNFLLTIDFFHIGVEKALTRKWKYPPGVFLGKVVLQICSKFTREYPSQSVILWLFASKFATHSKSTIS